MAKGKEVTFSVDINLSEHNVNLLLASAKQSGPSSQIIGRMAAGVLTEIAEGGVLLPKSVVDRIVEMMGSLSNPRDLIPVVEKAYNRKDGQVAAEWRIDPIYMPYLEDAAISQGRTVQQLIQDCMDTAMDKGWLYELDPQPHRLLITAEDMEALRGALGKDDVHGSDLVEYILQQREAA
jgi:hypothetical protein